ncbi:hypothetical protein ABZT06_39835 [Streptomyces sp. NPDC005483]|uniref:hypothetical protein n=1 Tax=Streptomyces sp. NPDC005483 TaxID=3154882 RepID=UPI0033A9C61E
MIPGSSRSIAMAAVGMVTAGALVGCSATSAGTDDKTAPGGSAKPLAIPATDGPGVTTDTVTVADNGYFAQSAAVYKAVIAAYNKDGGIAGRKIVLAETPTGNASATASQTKQAQATCVAFGQLKNKVFALLNEPNSATLDSCLNKQGTVVQLGSGGLTGSTMFKDAPYTAGAGSLTNTRLAESWPAVLESSGFLARKDKVAVVSDGLSDDDQVAKDILVPKLAEVTGTGPALYAIDSNSQDVNALKAQGLSIALKLKKAGTTRVVFFGTGYALGQVLMGGGAQGLEARYAMIGSGFPAGNGLTAAMQQATTGYAWNLTDYGVTAAQQKTVLAGNAAADTCLAILTSARLDVAQNASTALGVCDSLNLLKAALEASGSKHINKEAYVAGLEKLGDFKSLTTFRSSFADSRRDGVAAIRKVAYSASCKCFQYTGSDLPVAG